MMYGIDISSENKILFYKIIKIFNAKNGKFWASKSKVPFKKFIVSLILMPVTSYSVSKDSNQYILRCYNKEYWKIIFSIRYTFYNFRNFGAEFLKNLQV